MARIRGKETKPKRRSPISREEGERRLKQATRDLVSDRPFTEVGVREIAGYLSGEFTLDQATLLGSQATRNYAKRQFTWFRNQPPQNWTRIPGIPERIENQFEILFQQLVLT